MNCFCLTFAYSNTENVNRRVRGRIKRSGVPCRGSADMQQTPPRLTFLFFPSLISHFTDVWWGLPGGPLLISPSNVLTASNKLCLCNCVPLSVLILCTWMHQTAWFSVFGFKASDTGPLSYTVKTNIIQQTDTNKHDWHHIYIKHTVRPAFLAKCCPEQIISDRTVFLICKLPASTAAWINDARYVAGLLFCWLYLYCYCCFCCHCRLIRWVVVHNF